MAKKSGSRRSGAGEIDDVVRGLKRDAAPALAKALNLDNAEAIEAAMNAGIELVLAARAVVRSMPMPPEARAHLDRAEAQTLRAARMAARGLNVPGASARKGPAKRVSVDFDGGSKKAGAAAGAARPKKGARSG